MTLYRWQLRNLRTRGTHCSSQIRRITKCKNYNNLRTTIQILFSKHIIYAMGGILNHPSHPSYMDLTNLSKIPLHRHSFN